MQSIKNRCSPEDVLSILKELPNPLEDDEGPGARYNPLKIDVFVQTIFYLGHKSFSHSFAAIAKFNQVFKLLADSEEAQLCVLRSIYELWRNHQQMMCVLIDKMLKIQLLDCSAVANWIFSKEMSHDFTKMYIWEILHLTINKMSKYVSRLTRELKEAREKLARSGGANSSSGDESDDSMGGRRDDKPTEEMVERMEERLETAQGDQKNLFLIIFQRFIMILSEHLVRCDTDNKEFDNYWYRWTIGRLQQVFLTHHEQVQKYSGTLETLLFTQDLDPHILDVFHQFVALSA
ncbi:Nuclear cap Hypothetical protein protein subunit 1, 80kDa [Nesidiocoris tenuis]|uniref:MIF4G-like type 2 domain-containing protein n=1 Tax=Nesidiocoris tenuis TaxID=355587 RepID=A0ABN7AT67_9HEMI|nr:Nuclear cap Hypothetical protein protein subunit 1, 80kDa [Nesidiocoris tenuis]